MEIAAVVWYHSLIIIIKVHLYPLSQTYPIPNNSLLINSISIRQSKIQLHKKYINLKLKLQFISHSPSPLTPLQLHMDRLVQARLILCWELRRRLGLFLVFLGICSWGVMVMVMVEVVGRCIGIYSRSHIQRFITKT